MSTKSGYIRTSELPKLNQAYVDSLPMRFGVVPMAVLCGSSVRYVQNHFKELGGLLLAGKISFSRPAVLEMLGLARTCDA